MMEDHVPVAQRSDPSMSSTWLVIFHMLYFSVFSVVIKRQKSGTENIGKLMKPSLSLSLSLLEDPLYLSNFFYSSILFNILVPFYRV